MDETNATDTENVKPNETESPSPENKNEDVPTRLSPPIENQVNFVENTSSTATTSLECSDSKNDEQIIETKSKSNEELNTSQDEHDSLEAMTGTEKEPPDDPGEKSPKLHDDPELMNEEKEDRSECLNENEIKNAVNEAQNQSLIDDSEDLLVPTDFVPDSEDIISDEPKRKHSHCEMTNEMCKKFKHDPTADEDVSMQTESTEGELDEVFTENEEMPPRISPEQTTVTENVEIPEKCDIANDELNITDILTKNVSGESTIALADIIESVDNLIKKDDEQSGNDNSESVEDKPFEEVCSKREEDDASAAAAPAATADDNDEKSAVPDDPNAEELDFNISEKLKDMGEISLAPVSKTDRKSLPDFELGAEVSLEQICKKGADSDDKRNKVSNLRKNIREVMDDNQLDASTLAAQREELERLARVQEQQRMIREMQRQVALDRQNSKTQSKVLSLLTGHTSLLKSSNAGASNKGQASSPTISGDDVEDILSGKSGNLTPSVSIAPIKSAQKKAETIEILDISSGIEMQNEADTDSSEKLDKSTDDLLIVEDDDELSEEDDELSDDDDVIELKPKKDIVTIDDSSDDDCIM